MINIIVAYDLNRVIGKDNKLIWHFPKDLAYFKKMTLNKDVLFGYNTFISIYEQVGLLKERNTLVLTNTQAVEVEGVKTFSNVQEVLDYSVDKDVFICGGEQVYRSFLEHADHLYITLINESYQGDTYFPEFDLAKYELTKSQEDGILTFNVYKKL